MSSKDQRDKYLFDINNYKIIKEISKGGFGVINLVQNKKDGLKYAAKTNLIQNTKQNKLYISREVRILIEIQHQTIIQFQGFSYVDFDKKKNITILMDYMKNGSLAELISNEAKGLCPSEYDNTKRQIILIGISRGMMLLHKLHIIHRDLKPENILLDDDLNPHITDFGLSKFFDPNHSTSQSMTDAGTVAYMAPEVISGDRYNTKADVYAFGILMYEVLTGKRAYKSLLHGKKRLTIFQFKKKICEGLRPEIEEGSIKKSFQKMIEKCLSENPKERPTFSEIYRKLNLSKNDFLDFEIQQEPNKIDYEEDNDDEDDDSDENEDGINTTFCLDSVNYEKVLDYVDTINDEPRRYGQFDTARNSSDVNKEEIDELKQTIKMLVKKTEEQESEIVELRESVNLMKETVSCLKHELKKAKSDFSHEEQQKEISQLREELNQKEIEQQRVISQIREDFREAIEQHEHKITDIDELCYELQKINDEYLDVRQEIKNIEEINEQSKFDIILEIKNEIKKLKSNLNVESTAPSSSKNSSKIPTETTSNIDSDSYRLDSIVEQFKESLDRLIQDEHDNTPNQTIPLTQNQHQHQISDINELPEALRELQYEIDEIQPHKNGEIKPTISTTEDIEMIKNEINEKIHQILITIQCLKHEVKKIKASM